MPCSGTVEVKMYIKRVCAAYVRCALGFGVELRASHTHHLCETEIARLKKTSSLPFWINALMDAVRVSFLKILFVVCTSSRHVLLSEWSPPPNIKKNGKGTGTYFLGGGGGDTPPPSRGWS